MRDHTNSIRGFHWLNKAWSYENRPDDEIVFGMYDEIEGVTSGEMKMEWVRIGSTLTPQLRAYDDSWSALSLFSDLIQEMAKVDNQDITAERFVNMLLECGFRDLTNYKR